MDPSPRLTPPLSAQEYAQVQGEGVNREARLDDIATGHQTSGENPFRLLRRRCTGWVLACKKRRKALT